MAQLLAGKTAVVLGVANKWSIAYFIASAFVREGASLVLTYQGERQRQTVEELPQASRGQVPGESGQSQFCRLDCGVSRDYLAARSLQSQSS